MYELLKRTYYEFSGSKECAELGEMPEVKAANAKICDLEKYFDTTDYLELEEIVSAHGVANEMQGFVYGFRYGVQLMAECMATKAESQAKGADSIV